MTIEQWLDLGVREGGAPRRCDEVPSTSAEEAEWESGFDPRIPVVRLYEPDEPEPDPEAMSHFDRASMESSEAMGVEGW